MFAGMGGHPIIHLHLFLTYFSELLRTVHNINKRNSKRKIFFFVDEVGLKIIKKKILLKKYLPQNRVV